MSDTSSLSTLTLPAEFVADDVPGLRDQLGARIAAVVRPKGRKREGNEVALPDGSSPSARCRRTSRCPGTVSTAR